MIIIGLTGSVGTGKSETCNFFKRNRISVFDSDYEVKLLYKKEKIIRQIKERFPLAFINNALNKEKLAKIVFEDKIKLKVLETIIYKYLKKKSYLWIRRKLREKKKIVVFDVPLLFEKDDIFKYDKTVLVTCSEKIQKNRVLKRNGWNEERLILTRKQQLRDIKKKKLADEVINTDRGRRYVYNRITILMKKSIVAKKRTNNKIILSFKK